MVTSFCGHHVEMVMGMAVSIDIRDSDHSPEVVGQVVDWLHHVDQTFSPYMIDSPISRLGLGEATLNDVSEEVRDVLRLCEFYRTETDGVFDPFSVPAPNGSNLDPSGLVKGWAIEKSANILEDNGCRNFCVNAGGDIVLRGRTNDTTPWQVGIRHPSEPGALATVIETSGPIAIATSATYERGAHIIDTRTGEPTIAVASSTVIGPDLIAADVYATTVFLMGLDGLAWIEDRDGYDAYLITHDGDTFWTPGFNTYKTQNLAGTGSLR